jgi:Ca-activated chloride channel homolog
MFQHMQATTTGKTRFSGRKENCVNKLSEQIWRSSAALLVASTIIGTVNPLTPAEARRSNPWIAALEPAQDSAAKQRSSKGSGTLVAMLSTGKELGQCPLTHTSVSAQISGYVAKVKVTQVFQNTFKEPIEAIYTFPLSDSGAVDEMVMQIGKRKIQGSIKKRAEAKQIYDQAKSQGRIASLLDQERTNIFTQSVANIPPGEKIEVTLQYVETLPYESGKFSFVFPTVVGPRFNPGSPIGVTGSGREPDTDQVPDASRITPPVTPEGTRSGHDLSIDVSLNAGMPIADISSKLHEITVDKKRESAKISLVDKNTIPNKDFVLTWNVAGDALKSGYLTHKDDTDKSGYFTLMLLPPKRVSTAEVAPKEMIFLIDCSGSQSGKPLEKAKETLSYIIDHMNPQDTFQIIAFNNRNTTLFESPQAVSASMKHKAQSFIDGLTAQGGTWMAPAVEAACNIPADNHRLRIVTFMTDGFVGNDLEIIGMIRKLRETSRWFSFGTGNSVNRTLIDGIAQEGGGEADYVLLNTSGAEVGKKFYDHISTPVLTDVKVDFQGLSVKEVFPKEVADVWAERPLYFKGRYEHAGSGTVTLSGYSAGKPYKQTLNVTLPDNSSGNDALASTWARAKVDRLMREDLIGAQRGQMKKELEDEITDTALKYHIMSQFTSFVAVDETSHSDKSGKTIVVPTEMPDGVSREMTVGSMAPKTMARFNYGMNSFNMAPQSRHASMSYGRRANGQFLPAPALQGSAGGAGAAPAPHPSLAGAFLPPTPPSEDAAKRSRGTPLKEANARDEGNDLLADKKDEEKQRQSKLSVQVLNLLKTSKDAKAEVKIVIDLSTADEASIAKLKQAGLKVESIDATKKRIIGTIKIKDIHKLTLLEIVTTIDLATPTRSSK